MKQMKLFLFFLTNLRYNVLFDWKSGERTRFPEKLSALPDQTSKRTRLKYFRLDVLQICHLLTPKSGYAYFIIKHCPLFKKYVDTIILILSYCRALPATELIFLQYWCTCFTITLSIIQIMVIHCTALHTNFTEPLNEFLERTVLG